MTVEKSKLRMAATSEVGARIENLLDAARIEANRMEGAEAVLGQLSRVIEGHASGIDKALEANQFENLSPVQVSAVAKTLLRKILENVSQFQTQAGRKVHEARGKVLGFEQAIEAAKVVYVQDEAKLRAPEGQDGNVIPLHGPRASGAHPGPSIAEQRRAETQAAAEAVQEAPVAPQEEASTTNPPTESPEPETGSSEAENATAGQRARRRRRKGDPPAQE